MSQEENGGTKRVTWLHEEVQKWRAMKASKYVKVLGAVALLMAVANTWYVLQEDLSQEDHKQLTDLFETLSSIIKEGALAR